MFSESTVTRTCAFVPEFRRKPSTTKFRSLILQGAELWQRVQPRYRPLRNQRSDIAEALTPEQCTRLVTVAAQDEPFAVAPYAAVLALDSGMRSGEIKQLT